MLQLFRETRAFLRAMMRTSKEKGIRKMKNRTALKAFILFALAVTMGVWLLSMRKDLVEYFEPRQELLERGEVVQGKARIFHKEGLLNIGVRYIEIVYEKDGEEHTGEARMAQNFRKLPGEEDENGWHQVRAYCDPEGSGLVTIERAHKGWKLAKISLIALPVFLFLDSAILFLGFLAILAGNAAEEERCRAENNLVIIRIR